MLNRIQEIVEDMSPRQLLTIAGVAVVILFSLCYLGFSMINESLNEEVARKQAEQEELLAQVVVAKQDIPVRTFVTEDMLTTIKMPTKDIPKGAVVGMADVIGKAVQSPVKAGDIITGSKLYEDVRIAGFIGLIPPDCRAVTVAISKLTSTAGFAKPGDKVDVVLIPRNAGKKHTVRSEILLQNVTLLAINEMLNTGERKNSTKTDEKGVAKVDDKPIDNPASATLALVPDDAMKLLMAAQTGTIYLVLRPLNPTDNYLSETFYSFDNLDDSTSESSAAESAPAPAASARPAPAFRPPASPVVAGGQPGAAPAAASQGSFEIIPWGGGN